MKRGQQWFERIIHCCIIITGLYIIYRGTGILAETGWVQRILKPEKSVEAMEEMTVKMYLPGYITVLEQLPEESPVYQWLDTFLPVLRQWARQAGEASADSRREEPPAGENGEGAGGTGEKETEEKAAGEKETGGNKTEERETGEKETEENKTEESETGEKEAEENKTEESETGKKEAEEKEPGKDGTKTEGTEALAPTETESGEPGVQETLGLSIKELDNFEYLLNHYFMVDADTTIDGELLNAEKLLAKDFRLEKNPETPQILIYHTHSQEFFLDSREEDIDTGILGIGDYLTEILEEKYGYWVIHDRGVYDLVDGVLDRSSAYDYARASVEKILEEYPTIEVIIDLHRDGVEGEHFVTVINGKPTARIMFFNGLSRNSTGESIGYLYNPYIEDNLGFSLQLQLTAQKEYPGFTRNIYLKGQRFNLHLRPRSLLIEAGTQLNTMEEEKNAMEPLADILNQVLQGEH